MADIEVFCPQQINTGEGPLWSETERALYWVDIGGKRLYRRTLSDRHPQSWSLPDYPGCLAEMTSGSIAVAMGKGIQRLDLSSGALERISAEPLMRAGVRFNDGKVDPQGRLWVGTMQNNFGPRGEPIALEHFWGALYRFDTNGCVCTLEEGIGCANTLAWSADGKHFYFADSLAGRIFFYDYDAATGSIRNKRLFFEAPELGIPDGSAIDVEGCLWNARWDGSAILRITPQGRLDRAVSLPVPRPTSCAFGGPDLKTLYVTSARNGLGEAQLREFPLSGSVFAITGIGQGVAVPAWKRE